MKRYVDMNEISDGKLYDRNDMVRADCGDCVGCSACCHGMGQSIVLDPYDIYRLSAGLHMKFEVMLADYLELNVVDGIILPNLKMTGEEERCGFLNQEGRCSIHENRPGICRLFPLGRFYEEDSFQYFLQIHECQKTNRSKVKVKKWIDTPDLVNYEKYINDWHHLINRLEDLIANSQEEGVDKQISLMVLRTFYMTSYDTSEDFYTQFYMRFEQVLNAC